MKWILVLLVLAAVAVLTAHLVGRGLPREHRASRSERLRAPVASVFAAITRVEAFPQWRSDVKSVEALEPVSGRRRYRETGGRGALTFEVSEQIPNQRLVTAIVDEGPFGGRWTFDLQPQGDETALTITEDGFVNPPLFRFLSRYVFGHATTMERYLANLSRRLESSQT